jgi:hypothetical protein
MLIEILLKEVIEKKESLTEMWGFLFGGLCKQNAEVL